MAKTMERAVVVVLAAVAIWIGVGVLFSPAQARSATGAMEVTSYTVQPGQTLWTYAEMITPEGGDVSESVDELMRLNDMSGTEVRAGQRIVVPRDAAR